MLLWKLEISIRQKSIFCFTENIPKGRAPSEFKQMRFWKGRNFYTIKTPFISYVLWPVPRSQHRFLFSNVLRAENPEEEKGKLAYSYPKDNSFG